jgi:hypothetical protein
MKTLEKNQISPFWESHGKHVQNLSKIMNKSQPTLNNTRNMNNGSRKEPQKCITLEKNCNSLVNKTKFVGWLFFSATSDFKEKLT